MYHQQCERERELCDTKGREDKIGGKKPFESKHRQIVLHFTLLNILLFLLYSSSSLIVFVVGMLCVCVLFQSVRKREREEKRRQEKGDELRDKIEKGWISSTALNCLNTEKRRIERKSDPRSLFSVLNKFYLVVSWCWSNVLGLLLFNSVHSGTR